MAISMGVLTIQNANSQLINPKDRDSPKNKTTRTFEHR